MWHAACVFTHTSLFSSTVSVYMKHIVLEITPHMDLDTHTHTQAATLRFLLQKSMTLKQFFNYLGHAVKHQFECVDGLKCSLPAFICALLKQRKISFFFTFFILFSYILLGCKGLYGKSMVRKYIYINLEFFVFFYLRKKGWRGSGANG